MRVFVAGDLHGCYRGLVQALERSGFNNDEDRLICLGDYVDGWSETYEIVELLLTLKDTVCIMGNHDHVWLRYLETGIHEWSFGQGARATLDSYEKHNALVDEKHIRFFRSLHSHYIDDEHRLFIHGGFNRHVPLSEQRRHEFMWDRDLWMSALSFRDIPTPLGGRKYKFKMVDKFKEVFIGHTATVNWDTDKPMQAANIWNLDTGGGWGGKVTIMNVESKEYFQSDPVKTLYPDEQGRH